MKLSTQQSAVMSWAGKDRGHLNLVARAGCGKTTTLISLCEYVGGSVFLGAYNKKIAEEIKGKLAAKGLAGAEASTMHAAGLRAWKSAYPSSKVDENKMRDICKALQIPGKNWGPICKAVSIAKQHIFQPVEGDLDDSAISAWKEIFDHYEIEDDLPATDNVIATCNTVLAESVDRQTKVIDFDDMIYSPIQADINIRKYDWVLIDEAQDTNLARQELAIRMLANGSRLVAVGDDRQAIYGFTGAMSNAMDLIKTRLNSQELPLNLTYRCPKAVVRLANTWVDDIQADDSAPEGSVDSIEEAAMNLMAMNNQDVILCRNTKPIVKLAFSAIRRGRGVRVEGRDIGTNLLKLAEKFNVTDLRDLQKRTQRYLEEEIERYRATGKERKIEGLEDRCETLQVLISQTLQDDGSTIDHLKKRVESLFGDTYGAQTLLTLSTIHKAKGREWGTVYLLGRNRYQPSYYAKKSLDRGLEWPMVQEENLMYVAVTRAKSRLVEVNVNDPWKGRLERNGFNHKAE